MKKDDSLRQWCAQLHDDDGVDPRRYFKTQDRREHRKTQQLCRQAGRVLSLVFPAEFNETLLKELCIGAVVPGPDASRLVVQIFCPRPLSPAECERILALLQQIKGRLRQEVAQSVTRRRVPDLAFELVYSIGGAT